MPAHDHPIDAAKLVQRVPIEIETVGVFHRQNIDEVISMANAPGVSTVQLHGDEPAADFATLRMHGFRTIRALSAQTYLNEAPYSRMEYPAGIG